MLSHFKTRKVEDMAKKREFSGTIISVTTDGRSAFVELDENVAGKSYAVISPFTQGRSDVMNGRGELEENQRVHGVGTFGVDAIVATEVSPI